MQRTAWIPALILVTASAGCVSSTPDPATAKGVSQLCTETSAADSGEAAIALEWYKPGHLLALNQIRGGGSAGTVIFYESGEIQSVRLSGPDGTEIAHHWYRDGTPKIRAEWRGGELDGAYRTWHENGTPESEGRFARGERVGAWKFWTESGELELERSYDRAAPASAR